MPVWGPCMVCDGFGVSMGIKAGSALACDFQISHSSFQRKLQGKWCLLFT